jgi:hypothetical protein
MAAAENALAGAARVATGRVRATAMLELSLSRLRCMMAVDPGGPRSCTPLSPSPPRQTYIARVVTNNTSAIAYCRLSSSIQEIHLLTFSICGRM